MAGCKGEDAGYRRLSSLVLTMHAGDAASQLVLAPKGTIPTIDPTLSCSLESKDPASVTVSCQRSNTSTVAVFSCPPSGTRFGHSAGSMMVGNTDSHVVHAFSATCVYQQTP
jgi:hypothetical protein